jgi:hypothetical protein
MATTTTRTTRTTGQEKRYISGTLEIRMFKQLKKCGGGLPVPGPVRKF